MKRGPKTGLGERYMPRHSDHKLAPEMRDLVQRRTRPFLDTIGIDRPISFLLEEAYLQGMRDAVQAMTTTP